MRSFFTTFSLRSILLTGLLATVTWPLSAEAVNRYVASTGTDVNACKKLTKPCRTIGYAVSKALAGDTIFVTYPSVGAPTVSNITINKSLTITGNGVKRSILNANGAGRHFSVTGATTIVTLTNLDLRNGTAFTGGSISNSGLLLTLLDTALRDNSATTDGGAIYNTGTLVVNNSEIETNTAQGDGGGIYNSGTVRVINGSSVQSNNAEYGGGIYTIGGSANVQIHQTSIVSHNRASRDGGGVYVDEGSSMQTSDSTFANNDADGEGGAVYAGGGDVTITQSTLEYNSADAAGGAISLHNGVATITTSLFVANDGGSLGGAIHNADTGLYSITASSFEGNFATIGGAIGDTPLAQPQLRTISGSTFAANTAETGGAIFFSPDYAVMAIVNSTFSQNSADDRGGAIYNSSGNSYGNPAGGGTVNVANATFYGNAAGLNSTAGATIWNERRITTNNSIVTHSENSSTATLHDGTACGGTALPLTGQNNLIGTTPYLDASCATSASGFTLPGVTLFNTLLSDNGGPDVGASHDPLETHALLAGSSATGMGWTSCPNPITGTLLTIDQINQPRPAGGNACDVGAYELQ